MIELFKPLKDQFRATLHKRRVPAACPSSMDAGTEAQATERMAALGRPLRHTTPERTACEALFRQGRDLARQEAWDRLSALLAEKDRAGAVTPAGASQAEVLASGARSDLSLALRAASQSGALAASNPTLDGLEALDDALRERVGDRYSAALIALTHMDAGWAWYKQGWQRGRPEQHIDRFLASFDRARDALGWYSPETCDSPFLASTRCALLAGQPDAEGAVTQTYDRLITLAPHMPGHMRAFGLHMLPCWFGSHAMLDLQARRVASRTTETWGTGAYAWVYLDALLLDPGCFDTLDAGFFLDGIDDILKRAPGQHTANMIAAYLSRMLSQPGPDRALHRALAARRDRLIRKEMTETHAWVWSIADIAYATPGTVHAASEDAADHGMAQAWEAISSVLARERLSRGAAPRPAS